MSDGLMEFVFNIGVIALVIAAPISVAWVLYQIVLYIAGGAK